MCTLLRRKKFVSAKRCCRIDEKFHVNQICPVCPFSHSIIINAAYELARAKYYDEAAWSRDGGAKELPPP